MRSDDPQIPRLHDRAPLPCLTGQRMRKIIDFPEKKCTADDSTTRYGSRCAEMTQHKVSKLMFDFFFFFINNIQYEKVRKNGALFFSGILSKLNRGDERGKKKREIVAYRRAYFVYELYILM